MKKTISLSLCAVMAFSPIRIDAVPTNEPPIKVDTSILAICLVGTAAVAGGVIVWMMRSCKPKYYCVVDSEGNRYPSNATKKERQVEGLKVIGGPWNSAEDAAKACPPKTNGVNSVNSIVANVAEDDPSVYIPSVPIKIWKSTNLVNWILRDTIQDDPSHFSWSETNEIDTVTVFYRASY